MIGLLAVFGVIGITFLSLNSQQTSLFATQQQLNEIQHDRNMELFTGKIINCRELNDTHNDFVTVRINNTSNQILSLNSFISYNTIYQNVTDAGYFNNTKIRIPPQESSVFDLIDIRYDLSSIDSTPEPDSATRMILTSDHGNKIIINYDLDGNCVP
jgi:hypothetical protein